MENQTRQNQLKNIPLKARLEKLQKLLKKQMMVQFH